MKICVTIFVFQFIPIRAFPCALVIIYTSLSGNSHNSFCILAHNRFYASRRNYYFPGATKTRFRINRISANEANETHYSTVEDSVLPSLFRVAFTSVFNKKKYTITNRVAVNQTTHLRSDHSLTHVIIICSSPFPCIMHGRFVCGFL